MADAKAEVEELMNAALPFAQQTLAKRGEFYSYAYSMKSDHSIVAIAATDRRERPPSQDVIDLLKQELRVDAAANKIRASAVVYDVKINDSDSDDESDAIAVALDHVERYSVLVVFPYALHGSTLELGVPFSKKSASDVFSQ